MDVATLSPNERSAICRKDRETGLQWRLDPATEQWWRGLIDQFDLSLGHLRVLARAGKYALNRTETETWAQLVNKHALGAGDLRESIKCGKPTRIEREHAGEVGWDGVPTSRGLAMDFQLLRRELGNWRKWSIDQINQVRANLAPIVAFYDEIAAGGKVDTAAPQKATNPQSRAPAGYHEVPKGLREWRKRTAATQRIAANVLGVPIGTYRDWEQGRRTPRGPAFWNIQRHIS